MNKTDKEEKSKGKQKLRFFVCEALSVPGAATATGPVSGTGMIDLYKICLTRSLSPFCSLSILLAGFGVYLRGNMCLWLHIHVCTEEVVSTSADASSKSSQLHKPKVRCLLFLPLGTCGFPPARRRYTAECITSSPSCFFLFSPSSSSSRWPPQYLFWCS